MIKLKKFAPRPPGSLAALAGWIYYNSRMRLAKGFFLPEECQKEVQNFGISTVQGILAAVRLSKINSRMRLAKGFFLPEEC